MWGIWFSSWMINCSSRVSITSSYFKTSEKETLVCPVKQHRSNIYKSRAHLSKSYQCCLVIKLPTACHALHLLSASQSCFRVLWSLHRTQPEDWTLPTSVCGVSGAVLLQNHLRTDVWVPAWECTVPPSLLRMSLRCVTCGCHGDASENAGRAEVNVLHVGAKAAQLRGWHSPARWCTEIVRSLPPELPGVCVSTHSLKVFCYCCANMFKLMNMQVLTCPYSSLRGLIIHCYVET